MGIREGSQRRGAVGSRHRSFDVWGAARPGWSRQPARTDIPGEDDAGLADTGANDRTFDVRATPGKGKPAMVEVLPIKTPPLGDRSYLVHDGEAALVIDPQRDIDRVIALAAGAGVRVTHVAETHVHNDYVTGGLALARAAGAAYLINGDDPVSFDRTPVGDGDLVEIGGMRVRALATPGHTYTHLAYVVEAGGDDAGGGVAGVFTGGSLLYGSTGRTDLIGPGATAALTRAQWASARRLARELPDTARVFPTHGFGSFCSATQSEAAAWSTIGHEKLVN